MTSRHIKPVCPQPSQVNPLCVESGIGVDFFCLKFSRFKDLDEPQSFAGLSNRFPS
jgi:hypothetical protein